SPQAVSVVASVREKITCCVPLGAIRVAPTSPTHVWVAVMLTSTLVGEPLMPETVKVTSLAGPEGEPQPVTPRSGIAPNVPASAGDVVRAPRERVLLASTCLSSSAWTGAGCKPKRVGAPTTIVTAAKNRMVREASLFKVQDIVI